MVSHGKPFISQGKLSVDSKLTSSNGEITIVTSQKAKNVGTIYKFVFEFRHVVARDF